MMKAIALLCTIAAFANAEVSESSLKEKITLSLESFLASEVSGVENCNNKCDKVFNKFAYQISTVSNQTTYEYNACVQGCNTCTTQLATANADPSTCFTSCKNYDWKGNNMLKGVIEPDKACEMGCVVQTCQVICSGGTTDPPTKSNKKYFYPNGGCSIKTQPYSQNSDYVPFDSPNTSQGGSDTAAQCCSNALSLCDYKGSTSSTNYKQLLANTIKFCSGLAAGNKNAICSWYNNQANCGAINST